MIRIISNKSDDDSTMRVYDCIRRSCVSNLVSFHSDLEVSEGLKFAKMDVLIFVSPIGKAAECLRNVLKVGHYKVILFGELPSFFINDFGLVNSEKKLTNAQSICPPATDFSASHSEAFVEYRPDIFSLKGKTWRRYFSRFDYTDEWNNLGYGFIEKLGGARGLSNYILCPPDCELAAVCINKEKICSFGALFDNQDGAVLFFDRPIGLIDGPDWRIVEDYISDHRSNELPCSPVICEVPFGFSGAATMRLDCDEDIESAGSLIDLYESQGFPISLAVTTNLLSESKHFETLQRVIDLGGSLLSHSHQHPPRWGGDYKNAFDESKISKSLLQEKCGVKVDYAVAPFHHTPSYALEALFDAGYAGCIGGVANYDPEFIYSRGGYISDDCDFITHCQQSMLHGHTLNEGSDGLDIFREAFELSKQSGSWYGFLDHPFSARYKYDWISEDERLIAHRSFLEYIQDQDGVLVASESDCLDFILAKSSVIHDACSSVLICRRPTPQSWSIGYRYHGSTRKLGDMMI